MKVLQLQCILIGLAKVSLAMLPGLNDQINLRSSLLELGEGVDGCVREKFDRIETLGLPEVFGGQKGRMSMLETLEEDGRFKKLVKLVNDDEELRDALREEEADYTLFAPTDLAFTKMEQFLEETPSKEVIRKVIFYHIAGCRYRGRDIYRTRIIPTGLKPDSLDGNPQVLKISTIYDKIFVNFAKVIETDMEAANGVIHVIESVLIPPPNMVTTMLMFPTHFSTMTSALQQVEIARNIKQGRSITLFAPTNRAFRQLGCATLIYLFSPQGANDLKRIMLYHQVQRTQYSSRLLPENGGKGRKTRRVELKTLEGSQMQLDVVQFGMRYVNIRINGGARVIFSDLIVSQGVVQIIDQVLLPPDLNVSTLSAKNTMSEDACSMFEELDLI